MNMNPILTPLTGTIENAHFWSWADITLVALLGVVAFGALWTLGLWGVRKVGALDPARAQKLHARGQVLFGSALMAAAFFPYLITRTPGLAIGATGLVIVLMMAQRGAPAQDLHEQM